MDKSMMLIINPAAGRGAYKNKFAEAMHLLSKAGYRVDLYFTTAHGDATKYAADFGAHYELIACIGGDGTLSEVIAGMLTLEKPPKLGYLPMGTSNDVASTIGLPKNNCLEAVKHMLTGTPHPYDVGRFNGERTFAYIAAFGAFTEVSYATPQNQKNALGHLAYVLQGMALLPSIESVHTRVEYDGGSFEGDLIYGSMSNSTSVAGIVKFRENMVSLSDGLSELVLVKNPAALIDLAGLANSVLTQRFDSDNMIILHTRQASFHFDRPVAWTRDGEAGGRHRNVVLDNIHAPIQLIF